MVVEEDTMTVADTMAEAAEEDMTTDIDFNQANGNRKNFVFLLY